MERLEDFWDSPNGLISAALVQDERSAMFYLLDEEGIFAMCWARNFGSFPVRPPVSPDGEDNPVLLSELCAHPQGAPRLVEEELEVVFFESGDGAALYERGELLVLIPPGARGVDEEIESFDFAPSGFARDCLGKDLVAFPLAPVMAEFAPRLARARAFWAEWAGKDAFARFKSWRDERLASLAGELGAHRDYGVLQPNTWPIRIVTSHPGPGGTVCLTHGICMQQMPGSDRGRPGIPRRIEFGAILPAGALQQEVGELAGKLSGICNSPWKSRRPYGELHTLEIAPFTGLENLPCILLLQEFPGAPQLAACSFAGDEVTRLWLVPISYEERRLAMEQGSAALAARLEAHGVTAIWEPRGCTVREELPS